MDELIAMVHPESGGHAYLPDMPYWRNNGWLPEAEHDATPETEPDDITAPAEPNKEMTVDE